jgi:hypothetical protein
MFNSYVIRKESAFGKCAAEDQIPLMLVLYHRKELCTIIVTTS